MRMDLEVKEVRMRERVFWNELSECVRIVKVRENVVVLGDLNARVGDLEIENVCRNAWSTWHK